MPYRKQEDPAVATVREALNHLTTDQLKKLLALLPTKERPTRKGDLVEAVVRGLDAEGLRALWAQLDETQQHAVREALYNGGLFNAARFRAKYGASPTFRVSDRRYGWGYQSDPTPLCLFIYGDAVIPGDLQARLREFVSPPEATALRSTDELPEFFERREEHYVFDDDEDDEDLLDDDDFDDDEDEDDGAKAAAKPRDILIFGPGKRVYRLTNRPHEKKVEIERIPLVKRDTERAAGQDLQTVLRLIDKGRVAVSDKTFQPSGATTDELAPLLRDGDFYEPPPEEKSQGKKMKRQPEDEIGPVKAFAWPLIAQAAKLAELHGRKLALTKAGRAALSAPAHETIRLAWQRWLKSKLLDEFNRVDVIKGQYGKGKRGMTAVEGRRAVIAEALKQCPAGRWVKTDDFISFMQAAGFDFEVTREPWDLYIEDANYGSLGHAGYHDWPIVQGRYTLALLFEYAATLGLVDVAYVHPAGVRRDFREMWGTDDLDFLSRYDGLLYFRVNALGAYCLGLAASYVPGAMEARATLTVLPSLQINVSGGALSADEKLLLETWAAEESASVWRLDRDRALTALEGGHQIAELREFLSARDEQPLPETVEGFIRQTDRHARALKHTGTALLIECADAELAETIATHERTKKLCLRAGDRHLAVKADAEEQFRKALHALGYGMPRV
jgi:hypothetical protein